MVTFIHGWTESNSALSDTGMSFNSMNNWVNGSSLGQTGITARGFANALVNRLVTLLIDEKIADLHNFQNILSIVS